MVFWWISVPLQQQGGDRRPLMADEGSINARQGEVEGGAAEEEEEVRENAE